MSIDLTMLTYTAVLTSLLWLPYIGALFVKAGILPVLTYAADATPLPEWAARLKKAHYNAVENLVVFAVAVLVAHVTGSANEATAMAATIYFWSRAAHFVLYAAGVPFGRTLSFSAGWAATLWIFWEILTAAV